MRTQISHKELETAGYTEEYLRPWAGTAWASFRCSLAEEWIKDCRTMAEWQASREGKKG